MASRSGQCFLASPSCGRRVPMSEGTRAEQGQSQGCSQCRTESSPTDGTAPWSREVRAIARSEGTPENPNITSGTELGWACRGHFGLGPKAWAWAWMEVVGWGESQSQAEKHKATSAGGSPASSRCLFSTGATSLGASTIKSWLFHISFKQVQTKFT